MGTPKIFISYSHDSPEHKDWVLQLATDLRKNSVDASLDQWDLSLGQDVAAFMQKGIIESDRVLLICSENYVARAESGLGGVGYERLIVTADVVQNIDTKKFIPVVRDNNSDIKVPRFLGPRLYIDFSDDALYETKRDELLRELLGAPAQVKPPLGKSSYSSKPTPLDEPVRKVSPIGVAPGGAKILDDEWFNRQLGIAEKGIASLGLKAHMELRFGLHDSINKSQIDLVTSVKKSEIHTFGWPIAVTLDNRDEYRPRPYEDGIRAEISIQKDSFSGRESYDYWALLSTGDFFLLQSLFEDQRTENKIFFNTRIIRITEALLFASNLYTNLGVAPESRLSVRVTHRSLAARQLTSSSVNRDVFPRSTQEEQSQAEIVVMIGNIREALVDNVQRIAEPLFMLFDFAQFAPEVYTDIVRRFEKGEVS